MLKISAKEKIDLTIEWMKEQVCQAHSNGLLLGISGGLDSALVAFLIKKAFPRDSLGVILPCHSNPEDINDAIKLLNRLT